MRNRDRRVRRSAFTLMEILVVLVIIGLIIGLVAPRILNALGRADTRTAQAQIGMFQGALERYALDMRRFPTTEEGLQALVEPPADEAQAARWDGKYVDSIPVDPWGNPYQYRFPPERGTDTPDIWSFGPDGQDGTEDDLVSWQATE